MVKVKFKAGWFAPSEAINPDEKLGTKLRLQRGQMFRKGVQEVDEELIPFLPKSAVIVDKNYKEPDEKIFDETPELSAAAAQTYSEQEVLEKGGLTPNAVKKTTKRAPARKVREKM